MTSLPSGDVPRPLRSAPVASVEPEFDDVQRLLDSDDDKALVDGLRDVSADTLARWASALSAKGSLERTTIPCPRLIAAWLRGAADAAPHSDLGRTVAQALVRGAKDMPRQRDPFLTV